MAEVERYFQQRLEVLTELKRELAAARNRMVQVSNKKKSARTFAVGDRVFLNVKCSAYFFFFFFKYSSVEAQSKVFWALYYTC